jgi:class 3 adenylate cyclase/tetratricopeptide (TPR) repeat protein
VGGCPACGAPASAGQQFCGQCGAAVGDGPIRPPGALVEERKLATVVFADVVGFTSLAERTDPEIVARMVDTAFREVGDVVVDHGGTVDKYMGDSVMAVFGVPVAHDDDAERAVAAALAMRHLGGDLVFAIGVNSGEVMATSVGTGGGFTVIGDTVNVAARLEKAAAPGEVLCGRLTTELAGGRVRFRPRQPILLKGKRDPVEVWEAVALSLAHEEPAVAAPPLVGRHDELAFVEGIWRRVGRDRQSHVVVLCGDAGSGTSRLADELARVAEADGTVVRAAYPAYGNLGGARVAADVIGQLGPAEDDDVNVRVRSIVGELDESLKAIDPAGIHQEQLWALGRLLQEKAAQKPVLILIDDMHRSGDRTLEVLGELAGRLQNVAVLTVLAGRTEPAHWLSWFPAATTVRLGPLSRADALTLTDGFACDRPLTPEAAAFLVDRAGGNPLYLRELVAVARDQGLLVEDGSRYGLTARSAIPATLQALLAARLDALDPAQKLALQHTAVLGEATVDQVAGLGTPDASGALRALADGGLVRRAPDGRYDAVDSLLREVAYETLPRNVRGDLHRRAATLVSGPDERARHLDRAARYLADDDTVAAEAADALAEAGSAFLLASRHVDALRLFERAVARGCRRPAVLLDMARVQTMCGKPDEAYETLAMVDDDPHDPTVAAERDHIAANTRVFTDPGWALPRLEAVTARWSELGRADKEAWGHANMGVALFYLSRMEEAAGELERGLEIFEGIGDRTGALAASSFLCLAKPTDRRVPRWLAEALEFADETGDRTKQLTTLTTLAWHHFIRSLWGRQEDTAEAETFARRLAELAEELNAGDLAMHGRSQLAIMSRFSGRMKDAAGHAQALQRLAGSTGGADPWLGWAASFAVAVAGGATGATPPFPPEASTDPVIGMAQLVIEAELTLAGRVEEALARRDGAGHPALGVIGDLAGLLNGAALVLAGRGAEARAWVDRAAGAARALGAGPTAAAAGALMVEITGERGGLVPAPSEADGVSDALVLRAHALLGDTAAAEALRRAASSLAAPGLLRGL